jgi:hypothetical protein
MTNLYGSDILKIGGTKVKVLQVLLKGQSDVLPIVIDMVTSARGWLQAVLPELRANPDPGVKAAFNACFINPPDTNAAMNQVRSILQTIYNNLNGDFALKLLDKGNAVGYVNKYYGGRVHLVGGVIQYDKDGDPISRRGTIHVGLEVTRENPVLATVTLIHEAGHKWISLQDHGDRGYFNNACTKYWVPGLTWQEALKNADSHAVFVYQAILAKFKTVQVHSRVLTVS